MRVYKCYLHKSLQVLRKFYTVLVLFNRERELNRLVNWSQQKKLQKPTRLYENRLNETQRLLFRARKDAPKAARFSHMAFMVKEMLCPRPRYCRKGAAAAYKRI